MYIEWEPHYSKDEESSWISEVAHISEVLLHTNGIIRTLGGGLIKEVAGLISGWLD